MVSSLRYSLMRDDLCRKQTCTVTVIHYCTETVNCWSRTAAVKSSIDSRLFVENRDFCLPHLHSTPPLGWSPSEYCQDVWCGKLDVGKSLRMCLFISRKSTNVAYRQTDRDRNDGTGRACIASHGNRTIYSSKIAIFSYLLASLEFYHNILCEKTRMVGLVNGENVWKYI